MRQDELTSRRKSSEWESEREKQHTRTSSRTARVLIIACRSKREKETCIGWMERLRRAISSIYFAPLYTYPIHICPWTRRRPCLLHTSPPLMHSCPSWHARIRKHPAAAGRPALAGFIPAQGHMFHDAGTNVKWTGFKKCIAPHALPSACAVQSMARLRGILPALWSFARSAMH
jgi:hypothetical protein